MAEPLGETAPLGEGGGRPGPWADGLSVGLLLARAGRLAWANARGALLLGSAGGAPALRGKALDDLLREDGEGLPDWTGGADAERSAAHRLRTPHGTSRILAAPLGAGPEPESHWWELRPLDAPAPEVGEEGIRRRLEEAERALAAARERAEREAAEREELLHVVSHELRTPLTVIAGFNNLLLSESAGALTERQRHFLEESARSCRRLATFAGNLIGAAREASGDEPPELCEASLAEALGAVARSLEPLSEERGVRIVFEITAGSERARLDPLRIEQMTTNLLSNALRYSPERGTIRVRTRPVQQGGVRFVEVAIDDEGPGIPEPERERVFGKYVRGSAGRSREGLGLGLALCRRIVEIHGGTIRAAESPEGGARLVFTLPAADAEEG